MLVTGGGWDTDAVCRYLTLPTETSTDSKKAPAPVANDSTVNGQKGASGSGKADDAGTEGSEVVRKARSAFRDGERAMLSRTTTEAHSESPTRGFLAVLTADIGS